MRARNLSLGMSARAVLLAAGGVLGLTGVASGQTAWRDPVSGDWGTGTNWNNGVPTAISNASIVVPGGAFTVRLAGAATFNTRNLDVGDGATLNQITLDLNNQLLNVRGNYAQNQTLLLGQAATPQLNRLVVAGATTMTDATLQSTSVLTRGALTFAGVTMNDICDTDMDHRGSTIAWNGTGLIQLDQGGSLTNGVASTFTISNSQLMRSTTNDGVFTNAGRLVKATDGGTTMIDQVSFTNSGTVEVQTGTLRANDVASATYNAGTLNTGVWKAMNGRRIELVDNANADLVITTNNADVTLSGAGSFFSSIDANLATIGAAGKLTIQSGRDFTSVGNFTNSGTLTVGTGQRFTVPNTFTLSNLNAGTLAGGAFVLQGRLQVENAAVTTLNSKLTLDGVNSGIVNQSNADAITALARSQAGSELIVKGGRILTTSAPTYTVDAGAKLSVGTGSRMTVNALDTTTFSANRLSNAVLDLGGVFQFNGADVRELATSLSLTSPTADVRNQSSATGIGAIGRIMNGGALTVAGGKDLTTTATTFTLDSGSSLTVSGSNSFFRINGNFTNLTTGFTGTTVNVSGHLRVNSAGFTTVQTGINILPGGRLEDLGGNDLYNALNRIQTNATFSLADGETRNLQNGLTVEAAGSLIVGQQPGVGGAILNMPGNLAQQGGVSLFGATMTIGGNYALGGRLAGDGVITAPATAVTGIIAPGHSPDDLVFNSNLTIFAGSSFEFEIGAPEGTGAPGDFSDFILVNGTLTFDGALAGTLNYNFISGFEPEVGDMFVLARATGGIAGLPAATLGLGTDIGAAVSVVGGTDLVLTVTHLPTPGAAAVMMLGGLAALRRRRA